ncbi:DNA-binding protein [Streptomyces tsukubensis]|uniref:DNA-binding protein n=1 Tax=Streptomyces tsukubensis TaxID=83656 RepID=A0A1V4A0M1_9ACTN|nr:DNA-binding protein [Streptomyces tsukubensis]
MLAAGAGEALEVVRAPAGRDVPVRGVGVYDAGETFAARDHVLVAVGVDTSSDAAAGVLRAAAHAGAAAVVMRRGARGPTRALLAAAAEVSAALVTRAPWIEWTELIALLRAGLSYRGGPGGEGPATDVALGDLPGLANAFAALVGGAITIEDPDSRVLAFSRTENGADPLRRLTILGQRVPRWRLAELTASGFLRTLWSTDDVVRRPAEERFPERLAIAVRAGEEVLGSLWAAADGAPLRPGAVEALREAARTAAPHLLHHRLRTRSGSTRRRQAVRALLDGAQDVTQPATVLGLAPDTACAVLTMTAWDTHERGRADAVADSAAPRTGAERALRLAALQATAHHPAAFTLHDDDLLEILLPLPSHPEAEARIGAGRPAPRTDAETGKARSDAATRARRLGTELAAAVRGAGSHPLVAVGPPRPDLAGAADSRREAHLVLRVLRAGLLASGGDREAARPPEVAEAEDVRAALDTLRVVDTVAALSPPVTGPARELISYDAEHRTDLARTLAVFLTRFGDVAAASRQLGVHPNTLRYRLRRLRTLFALDLDDPDVRLLAELGLRAAGLLSGLPGPKDREV